MCLPTFSLPNQAAGRWTKALQPDGDGVDFSPGFIQYGYATAWNQHPKTSFPVEGRCDNIVGWQAIFGAQSHWFCRQSERRPDWYSTRYRLRCGAWLGPKWLGNARGIQVLRGVCGVLAGKDTGVGTQPDVSFRCFADGIYGKIAFESCTILTLFAHCKTRRGANPEAFFGIFKKGVDKIGRESGGGIEGLKIKSVEHSVRRPASRTRDTPGCPGKGHTPAIVPVHPPRNRT